MSKCLRLLSAHFRAKRLAQWASLELQGEFVRRLASNSSQGKALPESFTWLKCPWKLSDVRFSWQIKCMLNLTACRWNLFKWKKKPNARCQWCFATGETPMHALNGCKSAARFALYKKRHDAIQNVVADAISGLDDAARSLTVDRTFRGTLASSSLRPDIIVYHDSSRKATIADVKSPFHGASFDSVHSLNCKKYGFYDRVIRRKKWSCTVDTLICSSSGIIPSCTKKALVALGFPKPLISKTLQEINIACIKAGYAIRKTLGVDRNIRGRAFRRRPH